MARFLNPRREKSGPPANAPKGPAAQTNAASSRSKTGPVRSVSGGEGKRGGGRGRGGKGAPAGGREKKTPKTATDLDAELDAFMKAPPATASMAESEHAPKPGQVSAPSAPKTTEARKACKLTLAFSPPRCVSPRRMVTLR